MFGATTHPSPAAAYEPPGDRFAPARAVADALLYEGYLLYPYRRSAGKNRMRWQFGVLTPRPWIEQHQVPDPGLTGAAESWFQQVQCLAEAATSASLHVRLRFLQAEQRQVYRQRGEHLERVDSLTVGDAAYLSFAEALPREVDMEVPVAGLLAVERRFPMAFPGDEQDEPVTHEGRSVGRVIRTSRPLQAQVRIAARRADAPFPLLEVTVHVQNTTPLPDPGIARDEVLLSSLLATHMLIALDDDQRRPSRSHFMSLLDPPAWAANAAAQCHNRHVFPVLAGADPRRGRAELLICSPILLYDHPQVAPESPGDLHDAAEIDEILSLRTLTLTEQEKREARATDPRAAEIVDRIEAMPPELLARLHGALRDLQPNHVSPPEDLPWWDPRADAALQPLSDTVQICGHPVSRGSRVRLRPRPHGTDAQDMFLAGRPAQVQAVLHDVDGSVLVAVVVEDDPAADLLEWYGRYFQFPPEELEPLDVDGEPGS